MRKLTRALSMLLVCCMMFTLLPVTALAANESTADGSVETLNVVNYYNATGKSTNTNIEVRGVAIDNEGKAWCIIATNQSDADKHDFTSSAIIVDGKETNRIENPTYYENLNGTILLKFPDDVEPSKTVSAKTDTFPKGCELYVIEIGTVDDIAPKFQLNIDAADNGWDIVISNPPVEINMGYDIIKSVKPYGEDVFYDADKDDLDGEDGKGDGNYDNPPVDMELGDTEEKRTITYKVVVKNTGDHPVYNVLVNDTVPGAIHVQSITAQQTKPEAGESYSISPSYTTEGKLVLEGTPITFPVGFEKEYIITAVIEANYRGGEITNTANIESEYLLPDSDDAIVNVGSYFYVHHIYNDGNPGTTEKPIDPGANAKEVRVDKILVKDVEGLFDVTADTKVPSIIDNEDGTEPNGTYDGMWDNTLYGGTFQEDWTTVFPFTNNENGIGFTPKVNAHYYVWEPSHEYLMPQNMYVWHPDHGENPGDATLYHTVHGYPVSIVDRKLYKGFGFNEKWKDLTQVYDKITVSNSDDGLGVYTPNSLYQLSGYLGCVNLKDTSAGYTNPNYQIFTPNIRKPYCRYVDWVGTGESETFNPYWVTMDNVKVTGEGVRTMSDRGVGPEVQRKKFNVTNQEVASIESPFKTATNQILAVSAMFLAGEEPVVVDPATVVVAYDDDKLIYSGNSGNVKAFTMTADLSEFDFDEAWFVVDGEKKDLTVEAERDGDKITAELNLKKVGMGEVTIIPYWSLDGEESHGSALTLNVEKKMVRADSVGLLTDEEYVEVVPTEEAVETEATEEVTEETEAAETEAVEETTEATEAVEESNKKNDKKNNNKKNDKNDKKNNKKDEVAETEPVEETVVTEPVEETVETEPTEAPVEIVYEEITTVTFVGINREFASAPVIRDEGVLGFGIQ